MKRARGWPLAMGEAAYHGVVGEYVRAVDPHTEADPAAVLVQALVCLGNAMGRRPHFFVEETRHGTNLFSAVVGDTSMARKGTALDRARKLPQLADPSWAERNDGEGGLSTAEGLIAAVRDREQSEGRPPAADDKRLLAAMGEFSETLAKMGREGNALGATLRGAWDGKSLRIRTKAQPMTATGAHISVIGHITEADLKALFSAADVFNGFANRFLWVMAKRSKTLPFGGSLRVEELGEIVAATRAALWWADDLERPIELSKAARAMWPQLYEELGQSGAGRFGAVTDRAEPQVRRLALIYAVLDRSTRVTPAHLRAAREVWRYCEDSAAYVFGSGPPSGVEGRTLRLLERRDGRWTPRSSIQRAFKGRVKSYTLDRVLEALNKEGLIQSRRVRTAGRPREEYRTL